MALIRSLSIVIITATIALTAAATDYYIDADNGNDLTGDGSQANPWQSLDQVRTVLTGGDNVIMASGNYGPLEYPTPCTNNIYDDWVTFMAADGADVEINNLRIAYHGACGLDDSLQKGLYDAYIRVEGVHILDGVYAASARHWAIVDCLVERFGPWTGSVTNIEKIAVSFRSGTDILIENCEITNTGVAIAGRGHDVRILNNHIHHGSHDGIRVNGFWDSLVEGNRIHDFDDGVTDAETADAEDPEYRWSRHCDLIHIFIPGPGLDGWQNHNVIFRNNVLYNPEAQIVQFNNYYASPIRNEQILFENNIFGPSHANLCNVADPVDGFIFRNNTVVVIPGGVDFNRWHLENYTLRISQNCTDVEIYNNILGTCAPEAGADLHIFDYNIIQIIGGTLPKGVDGSRAYGRFTFTGDPMFVNPSALDGIVDPSSPVINFGTLAMAPSPLYPFDILATARDLRPDLGAWELPGQSPDAEPTPNIVNDQKTIFVEDFEDGHYIDVDPWLNGPHQQGMSWHRPDPVNFKYYVCQNDDHLDRNSLWTPTGATGVQRIAWLLSDQGEDWRDYDFEFDAHNSYLTAGSGVMILAQDPDNFYWVDICRDTGYLYRMVDGIPTQIAESSSLRLPHSGEKHYKFFVRHDEQGITISADTNDDGVEDFSHTDTDPIAMNLFQAGGVGFYENNDQVHLKIKFDNIRVELQSTFAGAPVTRQVFYNNSAFDGNDPAANPSDDAAIATDKLALLPGESATSANYTSYDKGINGLIVDINNLSATVDAGDFEFNTGEPGNWTTAPAPTSITVRPGQGSDGSDRITIIWPDNAIINTWLQVKILATANTGLSLDDVFYFGNAVGDTCNSATDTIVDATDEVACRNHPRNFIMPAPIDYPYDLNRDAKVDATDEIISRNNTTTMVNALPLITAP